MNRWYVAGTHAGLEGVAKFRLEQQGYNSFLPVFREKLGGGRFKERRLFPCYIFVELDLDGPDWRYAARAVNGTRGVTRLMPLHLERPSSLPVGFVEALMAACAGGEFDALSAEELARSYVKGEMVPVVTGTFTGFSGPLCYYKKGSAVLLLALFGRQHEVHIPLHCIAQPDRSTRRAAALAS